VFGYGWADGGGWVYETESLKQFLKEDGGSKEKREKVNFQSAETLRRRGYYRRSTSRSKGCVGKEEFRRRRTSDMWEAVAQDCR